MKALLLLAALGSTVPAAAADLDSLLKQPISAGTVALLVSHLQDQGAQKRVLEGLEHEDAGVRAVAARVAHVRGMSGAAVAIRRQLEKETDRAAAIEQLRALATFDASNDAGLLAHARRVGVAPALLAYLPRLRGPASLSWLREPELKGALPPGFLRHATRGWTEGLEQASALVKEDPGQVRALLEATAGEASLPPDLVTAALRSTEADVRMAAYWYVASVSTDAQAALGAPAVQALEASPDRNGAKEVPSRDALAFELASRALGRPTSEPDWSVEIPGIIPPRGDWRPVARLLTAPEKKAVSRELAAGSAAPVLHKATGFPPGLVGSLLEVVRCKPHPNVMAVAEVTYRADGRPTRIGVLASAPAGGCTDAHKAAFALSLAPDSHLGDRPARIVTLFDEASVACLDEAPPGNARSALPVRWEGSRLPWPKRVRQLPLIYPMDAAQAGIEGTVVLEATISPGGCTQQLAVLRSADAALDVAAMRVVTSARYEPSLTDGVPVPVQVTLSIPFKLSGKANRAPASTQAPVP